jgi:hypothetical protein
VERGIQSAVAPLGTQLTKLAVLTMIKVVARRGSRQTKHVERGIQSAVAPLGTQLTKLAVLTMIKVVARRGTTLNKSAVHGAGGFHFSQDKICSLISQNLAIKVRSVLSKKSSQAVAQFCRGFLSTGLSQKTEINAGVCGHQKVASKLQLISNFR